MIKIDKKKTIKIAIIVLVILFIMLLFLFINQKILENKKYNSIQDIPSNKAALSIMKSKYIKEEKSKNTGYELDIYVEFGKPLFEEDSNEIYYSQLTQLMAVVNKYVNFRLIDEKQEVLVAIICDTTKKQIVQTIINGDSNFYGNYESYKALKSYTETKATEFIIQSMEIEKMLENDWKKDILNFNFPEQIEDDYTYYASEGIKIRNVKNKVFNLIFTEDYSENIVNDLTTKSTLQEVIQKLGNPTFGSLEEQTIGYKNNQIYIFFTEDEVSVYRVEDIKDTDKFIEEVNKYISENNLKVFVSNVTDIWNDYERYYYDSNTVDLEYILKGVKIQYSITSNHGITFYRNYTGNILENKNYKQLSEIEIKEIPKYIYFSSLDSVEEYELNRAEKHRTMLYNEEFEEIDDYFKMDLN